MIVKCTIAYLNPLSSIPIDFDSCQRKREDYYRIGKSNTKDASFQAAECHKFFSYSIEYRIMQGCSHTQAANFKDCSLCRVKRAVCINHRIPALRKECLATLPYKQPQILTHKKQRSAYHDSYNFTETNYSLWLKKMEQKRLKKQPKPKMNHPEIDWSLFGVERHRPRFDRWQSKLLLRLAKNGRREELMRNMSLF